MQQLRHQLDYTLEGIERDKKSLADYQLQIKLAHVAMKKTGSSKALNELLSSMQNQLKEKKGFFSDLFLSPDRYAPLVAQIASLETRHREALYAEKDLYFSSSRAEAAEKKLANKLDWQRKIELAIAAKEKKQNALIELKAAAAKNVGEVRVAGLSIKKTLARELICPYCGSGLGADAEADHIYPVSKGGRSVPKNMVYACRSCNQKKRDLTLRTFISKYDLDRSAIENRLEALGKDF